MSELLRKEGRFGSSKGRKSDSEVLKELRFRSPQGRKDDLEILKEGRKIWKF